MTRKCTLFRLFFRAFLKSKRQYLSYGIIIFETMQKHTNHAFYLDRIITLACQTWFSIERKERVK